MRTISCLTACLLIVAAGSATAPAEVIVAQFDNFENGTTQGWDSGDNNPHPPVNVASGGPAGVGDNYLKITATGGSGAGSKLVASNTAQWTGDYQAAGVTEITMDLENPGSSALQIRLVLEGSGGAFVSRNSFSLPASSGWLPASFLLGAGDLTGGVDYDATLGHVTRLRLIHNPSASPFPSSIPPVVAQLGVDNITAVPEPATLLLLAIGGLCLLGHALRRRTTL